MHERPLMMKIVEERVRKRREIIEELRRYSESLSNSLGRVSVILFGSTARGDFNLWSDIDIVVISESFEGVRFVERCLALEDPFGNLSPICWTPDEFRAMLSKPAWREALRDSLVILDMHGITDELRSLREQG